jgi:hypothetical protein
MYLRVRVLVVHCTEYVIILIRQLNVALRLVGRSPTTMALLFWWLIVRILSLQHYIRFEGQWSGSASIMTVDRHQQLH